MIALVPAFLLCHALDAAHPAAAHPDTLRQDAQRQDGEDQEVVDEREEIAALLDALRRHTKKKGEQDDQAVAVIDELQREFAACGPKDRAAIVKALEACFRLKRGELEPGIPDDRLVFAAATSLGAMGPESAKALVGLLGHRSHSRNLWLQARIASSLGKTRDPRGVKPLLALLRHKDRELQAAGAGALGDFEDAEPKTRKQIFEELLEALMSQKAARDDDTTNIEAWERWNAISGPIIASMQRLSRHDERDPDAWQRWWNKHERGDWGY